MTVSSFFVVKNASFFHFKASLTPPRISHRKAIELDTSCIFTTYALNAADESGAKL